MPLAIARAMRSVSSSVSGPSSMIWESERPSTYSIVRK